MGNVPLTKLVGKGKANKLTKFQRQKLKYDFDTFFDLNNDGHLSFNDLLWAKDKICFMSGWKIGTDKYKETEALFKSIWTSLEVLADIDKDGKITKAEWLLMWTEYKKEIIAQEKQGKKDFLKTFYQTNLLIDGGKGAKNPIINGEVKLDSLTDSNDANSTALSREQSMSVVYDSDEEPPPNQSTKENRKGSLKKQNINGEEKRKNSKTPRKESLHTEKKEETNPTSDGAQDTDPTHEVEDSILPKWLTRYLQFRFNLLDRTGDGIIDNEEFEYVLSEFGCSERVARQAFTIVTKNNTVPMDFDYFVQLFEQYYLSDDPSDLGNFINGKLDFNSNSESGNEESDDEDPGLEDHKIDSNASLDSMDAGVKKKNKKADGETIKLCEHPYQYVREKCDDFGCCSIC